MESISDRQLNNTTIVLSPASSPGEGLVVEVKDHQLESGAVVVTDSLKASDLAGIRGAKAVFCTRGSLLSHPVLVA